MGLGDAVEDFPQPLDAVGRQVDCNADSVHNPTKKKLDGVPASFSFAHLLDGDRLAAGWWIVCSQGSK